MLQLKEAREGLRNAEAVYVEYASRYHDASAVVCGLTLLEEHAPRWPGITGYSYNKSSEYDDEGGYFDVCYIRPRVEEGTAGLEEAVDTEGRPEEDYDTLDTWSTEACERLFVYSSETLSLDEIRQRIVELSGGDPNS